MPDPDEFELDAIRDGLGLIEAAHNCDLEGGRVLLDNADVRLVCAFLARVAADLVEDFAESPAEVFAWLRRTHQ